MPRLTIVTAILSWAGRYAGPAKTSSVAAAEESSGDVTGRSVGAVKVTADCEGKLNVALVTVSAKAVSTGASEGSAQPAPPAPRVAGETRRPEGPALAAHEMLAHAVAQKITIRGGVKTGDCPASIRVLVRKTLVVLESDPQEVLGLPSGDLTYNLHGTVSCARQSLAVVDGRGRVSVANQKAYRCHWQRTGPKNYLISLESE